MFYTLIKYAFSTNQGAHYVYLNFLTSDIVGFLKNVYMRIPILSLKVPPPLPPPPSPSHIVISYIFKIDLPNL